MSSEEVVPWSRTKEYRKQYSDRWRRSQGKEKLTSDPRTCRQCGSSYIPKNTRARTCSTWCGRLWNKENRIYATSDRRLQQRLALNHDLSLQDYEDVLSAQNNVCKICLLPFDTTQKALSPVIDHDHSCCRIGASCDNCRRGIIHTRCNLVLGQALDNPEVLRRAADYLEEFSKNAI